MKRTKIITSMQHYRAENYCPVGVWSTAAQYAEMRTNTCLSPVSSLSRSLLLLSAQLPKASSTAVTMVSFAFEPGDRFLISSAWLLVCLSLCVLCISLCFDGWLTTSSQPFLDPGKAVEIHWLPNFWSMLAASFALEFKLKSTLKLNLYLSNHLVLRSPYSLAHTLTPFWVWCCDMFQLYLTETNLLSSISEIYSVMMALSKNLVEYVFLHNLPILKVPFYWMFMKRAALNRAPTQYSSRAKLEKTFDVRRWHMFTPLISWGFLWLLSTQLHTLMSRFMLAQSRSCNNSLQYCAPATRATLVF